MERGWDDVNWSVSMVPLFELVQPNFPAHITGDASHTASVLWVAQGLGELVVLPLLLELSGLLLSHLLYPCHNYRGLQVGALQSTVDLFCFPSIHPVLGTLVAGVEGG